MDQNHLAAVMHSLASVPSRRDVLHGLVAVGLGMLAAPRPVGAARKRTRKPTFNVFGCVDVGGICRNADQCCSGICKGKMGKKRCKAHDTGGCRAGQTSDTCGGAPNSCTTRSGVPGRCETTTGNAGYCAGGGDCFPCKKDADCQTVCGPRAACVTCNCTNTGAQCVGPDTVVCPL